MQKCRQNNITAASIIIAALLLIAPANADDCHYLLDGDLNQDCIIDWTDFAVVALNWLIDCDSDPLDPACIPLDLDNDGYDVTVDCDDHDANVNPGQTEICGNGIDDDCDSIVDCDYDGDGYDVTVDCDDSDPNVNPGQTEICGNGIDDDCDFWIDCDYDGDGYEPPLDCDDYDPYINPGQEEICDNLLDDNCDSLVDSNDPCCAVYSHTITIDGNIDFTDDETFLTTTPACTGFYAWDAEYLYVGLQAPQIASLYHVLLLYIGAEPGTFVGIDYIGQQPILPFPAKYHIAWDTGGVAAAYQSFGDTWQLLGWDFTGDYAKTGDYMELRIPLADIGSPSDIQVHLSMIDVPASLTFAGVPSNSFFDSPDPDYTKFFQFDLAGIYKPNEYTPLP